MDKDLQQVGEILDELTELARRLEVWQITQTIGKRISAEIQADRVVDLLCKANMIEK